MNLPALTHEELKLLDCVFGAFLWCNAGVKSQEEFPMKLVAIFVALMALPQAKPQENAKVADVLNFTMNSLDGKPVNLAKYQGNVVLMVNVASECGYTYQYEGLQALHKKYAARGLRILGFPSNDFGAQEPGTDTQIADFCKKNYGVEFDMFSKITVAGGGSQAPLYRTLTATPGFSGKIDWNFEKFLVGKDGKVVGRYKSAVEPMSAELTRAIETALAK
jgi:glutathione peroxidase